MARRATRRGRRGPGSGSVAAASAGCRARRARSQRTQRAPPHVRLALGTWRDHVRRRAADLVRCRRAPAPRGSSGRRLRDVADDLRVASRRWPGDRDAGVLVAGTCGGSPSDGHGRRSASVHRSADGRRRRRRTPRPRGGLVALGARRCRRHCVDLSGARRAPHGRSRTRSHGRSSPGRGVAGRRRCLWRAGGSRSSPDVTSPSAGDDGRELPADAHRVRPSAVTECGSTTCSVTRSVDDAYRHPREVRRDAGRREGRSLRLPGHQRVVLPDPERRARRASPTPARTASCRCRPAVRSTSPARP